MDNEFELVDQRRGKHEIVAAEDLEEQDDFSQSNNPQRRPVVLPISVVALVLIALATIVTKAYLSPGELAGNFHQYENGERGENGTISDDSLSDPVDHFRNHSQNINYPDDIRNWLLANVTLGDRKMYKVVAKLDHDTQAFTEGLTFANNKLYESTGMNGRSSVRELDPDTGSVLRSVPMKREYFGEGLTYVNGKLLQLTYRKKKGFIYDAETLNQVDEFNFSTTTGEGWGMTYHNRSNELIVSDGSDTLLFWNADTFEEKRRLTVVRQDGSPAKYMNELEWWRNRILANVWYEDSLIVIHPHTGIVEKEYDFRDLWPQNERQSAGADVLNGISVSADPDVLYMTGKDWDRMFKIQLLY